jgi:hypothetical protein
MRFPVNDEKLVTWYKEWIKKLEMPPSIAEGTIDNILDKLLHVNNVEGVKLAHEFYCHIMPCIDNYFTLVLFSSEARERALEKLREGEMQYYSLHPSHREHSVHQLRTYLLACYLLSSDQSEWEKIFNHWSIHIIENRLLKEIPAEEQELQSRHIRPRVEKMMSSDELRWNLSRVHSVLALLMLFHDIGYVNFFEGTRTLEFIQKMERLRSLSRYAADFYTNDLKLIIDQLYRRKEKLIEEKLIGALSAIELTPPDSTANLVKVDNIIHELKQKSKLLPEEGRKAPTPLEAAGEFGRELTLFLEPKLDAREFRDAFTTLVYFDCVLSILLHDLPFLYFISPSLNLLSLADNLQEWKRDCEAKIVPDSLNLLPFDPNQRVFRVEFIWTSHTDRQSLCDSIIRNFDWKKNKLLDQIARGLSLQTSELILNMRKKKNFEPIGAVVKVYPSFTREKKHLAFRICGERDKTCMESERKKCQECLDFSIFSFNLVSKS